MTITTARNRLRAAPIVEGMTQALIDEALVERNGRKDNKLKAARARYQAAVEVWSLAFRHLTGAPDAVAPMAALRDVMADLDPDHTGKHNDDVVARFFEVYPIGEMKYDEERMKRIMVTELIRAYLSAWSYEPERRGEDDDEAATGGQGINVFKVRQRSTNEEWYTSMVDTWAAVLAKTIHKDATTIRRAMERALRYVGASSTTWWTDTIKAFWLIVDGAV